MTAALVLLSLLASHTDSILKRGKPIPATPGITVGSVLANPSQYADAPVVLEGTVVRSCTKMGCWMQLADSTGAAGVRVDFHSEKFYIPVGAAGMRARAIGTVTVAVLKEEDVEHLRDEGAAVERNDKGQPVEVGLKATGVELHYVD